MKIALAWGLALSILVAAGVVTARQTAQTRPAPGIAARDPVLARCRTTEAGRVDPACQAAWRAARERFFGRPVR